jgi:hypothetical protein
MSGAEVVVIAAFSCYHAYCLFIDFHKCICTYIYIRTFDQINLFKITLIKKLIYIHVFIYVYIYVYIYACLVLLSSLLLGIHVHIHTYVRIFIYNNIHINFCKIKRIYHIYIYIYIYVCMYICMYVCIYI